MKGYGHHLIAKGDFPLVIMERRTAVESVSSPGNLLRFVDMAESNVIGCFRKDIPGKKITAAQLDAPF